MPARQITDKTVGHAVKKVLTLTNMHASDSLICIADNGNVTAANATVIVAGDLWRDLDHFNSRNRHRPWPGAADERPHRHAAVQRASSALATASSH